MSEQSFPLHPSERASDELVALRAEIERLTQEAVAYRARLATSENENSHIVKQWETAAAAAHLVIGRLEAENERLKEQVHYANGACDLAMKHRDAAEAENERLREGRDTMGNLWAEEKEHREMAEAEVERLRKELRR